MKNNERDDVPELESMEQNYRFERLADLLIAIKDSTPPDTIPLTVEVYNKEMQDVQMRGGAWGNPDFTTQDIDKAVGYLFDKMELYGWRLWRYETMFGMGSLRDRITIYLTK